MEERYIRNMPALTEAECELLGSRRIAVVGCGGLGGYITELMARVGVGYIRCIDGDTFEESNLNRQLLSDISLIGCSKAEAAKGRIALVNPDVQVEAVCVFLDEANAAELISGCDAVFDALDSIDARRILADACEKAGVPYVYGAIGGWVVQAAVAMPGDGFIKRLYPEGTDVMDKSVLSFVPAFCASVQAALGVKLLTGRKVETGKLYYFDLLELDTEQMIMGS